MAFSVLQWNCQGIYRKLPDLKNYLDNLKTLPDVIALQETHLISKYKPKLPGFELIRKDRNINGGGICMFIKNNISFSEIDVHFGNIIEAQCV